MFKLLKVLNKKDAFRILLIIALVVCQVSLELRMPDYMSEVTVLVQTAGSKMVDILTNGAFMLACALGSLMFMVFTKYHTSSLAATFSMKIRKKLFTKVCNLSINEIKDFSTSSLITRTTNDIGQVQMLIGIGLMHMVKAPITAAWAISKILGKSTEWSIATAVAVAILLTVIGILISIVVPRFKMVQKLIDKVNSVTRENLNGIRVVRAFNAEKYQQDKFEDVNNKLTNLQLSNQKAFAFLDPIMTMVMHGVTLSIYFIGAILIMNSPAAGKIGIFGDMVVFGTYATQVIMSFLMLTVTFVMFPRAAVSAKRINEVLDTDITVKDGELKENTTKERGTVEFKNVCFKYPDADEYLLKDISFRAEKGETVAFIGSTGSGKSTLINLIPRFYDATEGVVLVDGVDVKKYSQEFLYNKIGYVSQKAVIFDGTVNFNVAFGDNGKEKKPKKIKEAIEVAQAKDFVESMDEGYETELAQGGTNISGGQKQRISIARAIAREPEIYIFDDSFSALDYKTDSNLRKALKEYTKDATSIIVAQRIGTIMNADKIIVLDQGVMVGQGTHKELLQNCEVYKEIALSQLSEEELANG